MESILEYVKRRLLEVRPPEWPAIHEELGGEESLPRKLAYDRKNTRVNELEPYYRYFLKRDYGLQRLPHEDGVPIIKGGR